MFPARFAAAVAAAGALLLCPNARADSFAINEYSANDLGRAVAGRTTQTDDPAAAFGNPALMPLFEERAVSGTLSGIFGTSDFDDRGSTDVLGQPLSGGDTSGFLQDAVVPALHYVHPLNRRWSAGVSVTVPFGLATKYRPGWPGRYQALESELQTININPAIAYRVSPELSVGVGLNAQYADATLSSAIDFGAICLQAARGACPGPQQIDGFSEVSGDDWSLGWNAGLAWQPSTDWRFGLTYRSGIDHELEGDATFTVPAAAAPVTAGGAFSDAAGAAALDLPASVEAGARWHATPRWTWFASLQWTQWSSLEELRVVFDNAAQSDSVDELNYEDSWRVGIGADYALSDTWTLRGGVAFDDSPTQDAFRSARIPDNDRQIYAIGATWTPRASNWQVDLAYNRVEIDTTDFEQTGEFGDRLVGEVSGGVDILSVGFVRRF